MSVANLLVWQCGCYVMQNAPHVRSSGVMPANKGYVVNKMVCYVRLHIAIIQICFTVCRIIIYHQHVYVRAGLGCMPVGVDFLLIPDYIY